jgi:hypothetical protein
MDWRLCRGSRVLLSSSRLGCLEVQEQRWLGDAEGAEDVAVAGGELGALVAGAGRSGEGPQVNALEFVAEVSPA